MQESFAEITLDERPLVVFNMARGQQDYFQSTRGGGHGDYRHLVLAPLDIAEAVELTQLAFHLADKWRNPVLVYGDYLLAHTHEAVSVEPVEFLPLPAKFVRYVVSQLRAEGERIGFVRPISLWPYPFDAVAEATERATTVAVFELCAGQMIDDVRLAVLGRAPIVAIGGISTDGSGFG